MGVSEPCTSTRTSAATAETPSAVAGRGRLAATLAVSGRARRTGHHGSRVRSARLPPAGVSNGVLNQAARGTVQANLLQAAAKQNAAVIKQLQDRKAGLVAQVGRHRQADHRCPAGDRRLSTLPGPASSSEIAESEMRLEAMNASRAQVTAADRTWLEGELTALEDQRAEVDLAHQQAKAAVSDAQAQVGGSDRPQERSR